MNHGKITVDSEGEDQGSRFTFTMKMLTPSLSPKTILCDRTTQKGEDNDEEVNLSFGNQAEQFIAYDKK